MIKGIIQACSLLGLISMVSSCSSEVICDQAKREDVISQHCISIEDSRRDLIKILYDIEGDSTRAPEFVSRKICDEYTVNKRIETRTGDFDTLALHVFNFKDNMGYALMSGDNRIPSLLVLTEEGNLANNEVNSIEGGVSVFYERLENNSLFELKPVDPVFNGNIAYDEYNTYGSWENVIHTVNNCNVKWGQGNPYNKVVIDLNGGKNVLTGCVPTAVAQLMSIYKYPTTYNGQLYDWNKMTGETSAFYCSSDVQGQIAKLMAELGLHKHLNVTYGTSEEGGSGADSKNIPRTLSAFGYTSGGSIVNYDSSVLIEELKKGYPVLVSGFQYRDRVNILGIKFSYTYYTGHQWLAHGLLERRRLVSHHDTKGKVLYTYYESVFYPRYNWGWNGACDGYFLSTVFDVNNKSFNDQTRGKEGEEDNFQFNTKLVINIRR